MKLESWAAAAVLALVAGCGPEINPSVPGSGDRNSRRAHDAIIEFAQGSADQAYKIADQIDSGEKVQSDKLNKETATNSEKLRSKAFAPLNKAIDRTTKEGMFTAATADVFRSAGDGYLSVGKERNPLDDLLSDVCRLIVFALAIYWGISFFVLLIRHQGWNDAKAWPHRIFGQLAQFFRDTTKRAEAAAIAIGPRAVESVVQPTVAPVAISPADVSRIAIEAVEAYKRSEAAKPAAMVIPAEGAK